MHDWYISIWKGQIIISRLSVANSEICEKDVTRKIPHGGFEKVGRYDDYEMKMLPILRGDDFMFLCLKRNLRMESVQLHCI
jgi:hypothetical protein